VKWGSFLAALTARCSRLGFLLLILFATVPGAVSPALAAEKFCSDAPYFGVLDGDVLGTPPTQITIDTDCTFKNWPQSKQLTTTINFHTNDPTIYLIIFDNVFFTGHMACANVDHRIWFANSSDYGSSNACQDLFIPVETIDKKNPAGQTTAAIGVPFTYTLTLPSMQITGAPSVNDLHTVTLWDDLTATGADLTYVDINAYYKGSGVPVTLVPEDDPASPGGVWTPKNLSYKPIPLIAAGEQVVVEITVVLDNTSANAAGTQFVNTAKWSFGRLIDGVYYEPLPGEWGVTQPMTIAEPNLAVTKTSSETALNLGVPATFTIDVQNIGGSDAWNATILDQLPDGPGGGMCDYDPTTGPGVTAQIFAADGVTPVSGPLVQGTDYSVSYSGVPTCQLTLTMLDTPAAKVAPSEHLIITYQSQIDGDSADGIPLTNVAGVTRWFSGDSSLSGRHQYDRGPLTDGTPGVLDFQDSETVTTALAGYYFQKTVANLTSGANPATTAAPGDRLRYRLRLFNVDQTIDDVTISDQLDPNSFDLTTFAMVTPPPAGATYSFDSATGLLTISGDTTPLNVAVGEELVVEFDIILKSTLTSGSAVDNQAALSATGITANSDDPYVNGIAPPGFPADPTRVVIQSPRPLSKANTQASATVGEQFTYQITVPVTPIAAPLYDVRILDDLGLSAAGLRFVSANVSSGGTWSLSNTGTATDLIIEDNATGIDIPANGQAVIEVTVQLQNITTNQSGLSFENSASYTYNRMNGNDGTQTAGGAGSTTSMTVVEPDLTATKVASNATPGKAAGDPIAGGDIIQYIVTINNGGNSTAYDVNVVDILPSALTFYSGFLPTATVNLAPVSGFLATPAGTPGGPLVWGRDNGDGSLDIPVGGTLVLTYQTQVLESTAAAFSNLAWVDWTSLNDPSPDERTGAGCPTTTAPDDYCYGPVGVSTTTTDNNSLTKAIVADTYLDAQSTGNDKIVRIGDTATYRLALNLGEGATRSVTVQDVLPAGMAYESLVSITPASGSGTFTYTVVSQPAAGDTGTLAWDLGDVDNAPSNDGTPVDALVIEYRAKVLPDSGIAQTPNTSLNNTATLSYLDAGGNAVVDPSRLVSSDTLTLWQPVLSVNKTATPAGGDDIIEAGEAVTYTVDILNMGTAPAYDTVLVDTLPLGLRQGGVTTASVALVTAGTTLPVLAPAYDANTGVATWDFDDGTADAYTIPAGETLRVVYQVMADADLGAGLTLTNAATATLYYSFDDEAVPANGSVTDRQVYGPTNTAQVSLTTPTPDALLKENTQPTAAIGEQFTYLITVPAAPVNTALYDVRILDDLGASAADLRFVSVSKVSGPGSWTPVNTGTATNLVIEDTSGGIDIPAGEQVVVEVTVELLNTPANVVGLRFTNTADYTYNQVDDSPASQTSGLPGTTEPMQIVGLIAQKTVSLAVDNNLNGLVDPGDVLIYAIAVNNPGTAPVTGAVLADDVPANTTYVADSVTLNGAPLGQPDGGVSPLASGVAINSPGSASGTIAAGSGADVTFRVQVNAGVPAGTVISNQGSVTSNELPAEPTDADGNAANGYQPTTIVVSSAQQVMITKEVFVVGGGAALPGSELEYLVRVTNTGTTPTTNLVITDDLMPLAGRATYVAGSATLNGTMTGVSYAAPVMTADYATTYGTLLPGATATLRFRVLVDNGLSAGTRLTNTAQMAWNTPTLTATASVSIDIGGVLGSAMLSGRVWHDADLDKLHGAGETNRAGWTVGVYRQNVLVASATTDASGLYSFSGLEPTLTTSGQYELRFTAPGAGPNTASLGYADSPFTNGPQRISDISASSGDNLQNLNLPLWPNGTVYNSVARGPVGGARVTMLNAATGVALPGWCFDDPAQQNQVTSLDGFYKFDLNFRDASCPPGGTYLIEVTPPATGYMTMPSRIIGPASDSTTAPLSVPACPGSANDAVPSTPGYCEVVASAAVPPPSVLPSATGIVYHLHLLLSDGTVPGQSQVFNNLIPVDPELYGAVAITKTSSVTDVTRGALVPYTITVTNVYGVALQNISIVDRFPAGFKYKAGSARLDGTPAEPLVNGRELVWDNLQLQVNERRTIQLLLVVGSGVSEGEYINRAMVLDATTGGAASGEATATVRVIPDLTFDCTDVIGKVFDDRNLNGEQDAGEKGLPGARVVTVRGLLSTSDKHGRFHITCAAVPDEDRGSNFILKLDERSLPTGYRLTTENPRVQRATRGKMLRFNFGATIHRVVRIDIADGVFEPDTIELRMQWTHKIDQLLEELKKGPSVLRLSYLVDVEGKGLVQERLEALKTQIIKQWKQSGGGYRLNIETEMFWRRGAPLAGQ
jgi:uncharacterized repeat protein (TIGR01451 family)/fimbrial isopeptide formation D2 family protein